MIHFWPIGIECPPCNSFNLLFVHEVSNFARDRGGPLKSDLGEAIYLVARRVKPPNAFLIEGLDIRDELVGEREEPMEDLVTIPLHDANPHHTIQSNFFNRKMLTSLLGPLQICMVLNHR